MRIQTLLSKCGLGLHDAQQGIFSSEARFRLVLAGRRFGKSYLAASECLRMILAKPGCRIWIISPIHAQAREIMIYLMNVLDTLAIPYDYSLFPFHRLKVSNCRIECKSADNPRSMRGAGLDLVIIDEACHIRGIDLIWAECLRPALSDRLGKALIISSPRGADWVASLLDDPTWSCWRMPTSSNPYIDPDEIKAMQDTLPDVVFRSEILAEIVTDIGKAFTNLPDHQKPSGNQVWSCGIDWGYAEPYAALLISKDADGHYFIHSERYAVGLTPVEQASQILSIGLPAGCVNMADASCFTSAGRESVADLWQQAGLVCIPATRDRKGTIALLRQLLREGKIHYAADCLNLMTEFQNAEVDPRKPEDVIGQDHLLDCLRYAIAHLHLQSAPANVVVGSIQDIEQNIRARRIHNKQRRAI